MPDLLKYGFSGKLTGNLQLGDKDHSFRYINPLTSDHKPEVTSCGSFELPARLYQLQVFQELWMQQADLMDIRSQQSQLDLIHAYESSLQFESAFRCT